MLALGSFRRRIFAAILIAALLPAAAALVAAVVVLREAGSTTGTLGPWDAVAASGEALADEALRAAPGDSALADAAAVHREALSSSLRRSRLWAYVTDRFVRLLPVAGAASVLFIALLASLAAGRVSRAFSRPVGDLVGWTERIARSEPLPPPATDPREVAEFSHLRGALRKMADELGEARRRELDSARLRAWTEMARRVAHELKNPLTPMRLAAVTLARSGEPRTAETAAVLLEEIGRLDEMARTFSQFGRMPEGPPSAVDLEELLRALAARHATEDVPVRVTRDGDVPLLTGHYDVLGRVFRNLVVNAVEASQPRGGPVDVTLAARDGTVRVTVRDHGPGIPPEILDTLWLPDVTTKRKGTGLGLAIVRQGVEAHGGEARARNAEGGGAEFEVALPLGAASPA